MLEEVVAISSATGLLGLAATEERQRMQEETSCRCCRRFDEG
jgi:hypothetical protein